MMARNRIKNKPVSEINVVPYIDVMLVLLIIFMVTAPMLTQGVAVELPQAAAKPISAEGKEPLVVTVNHNGDFFINIGKDSDKPIDAAVLQARVAAVLQLRPNTPVLVRGDAGVEYGKVVSAMSLLQQAGAPSVGLITDPPEQ